MNLTEVVLDLRAQVAQSSEVQAFCQDNFGKQPKFMAGYNARKPPLDEDLPVVAFIPDGAEYDEVGRATYTIGLAFACSNKTIITDGNLVTYEGYIKLDAFSRVLLDALAHVTPNYKISAEGYDLWPSSQFPAFVGALSLTVQEW